MGSLLPFLKARFAERSSRVQLVVLAVMALVLTGVVTTDQLSGFLTKLAPVLALAGPLAGVLFPDKNHAIVDAAAQDAAAEAALALVTDAAEKAAGEKATELARQVGALADKVGL